MQRIELKYYKQLVVVKIKVIATKEQQLKAFLDILKELPKLLSEINTLRKEVDGVTIKDEVRGDQERPRIYG